MMNSSLFLTESTPAQSRLQSYFFPLNQACVNSTVFIQGGVDSKMTKKRVENLNTFTPT